MDSCFYVIESYGRGFGIVVNVIEDIMLCLDFV